MGPEKVPFHSEPLSKRDHVVADDLEETSDDNDASFSDDDIPF